MKLEKWKNFIKTIAQLNTTKNFPTIAAVAHLLRVLVAMRIAH